MFGFAWVGPTETTFTAAHDREDEQVFAFQLDHSEGDFPMLSVEIRNPRRRLLDDPNIWCWLSQDGVAIFFGRLVAIPEEMEAEIVRINFIARPLGYAAAKEALAETLRVEPFWDPVWITDERESDPDVVLEARTQIWHIDRVTHAVTVSDIILGEDGTVALDGDDFIYESLDVTYGSPPVRKVRVDAEVSWDQTASGEMDISPSFASLSSYTGQGLQADWPSEGMDLGGGWRVTRSNLRRTDTAATSVYIDVPVDSISSAGNFYSPPTAARFYRWDFNGQVSVGYNVSRVKTEHIRFELVGNVQRVFTEPGEEEEILLGLATQKVTQPVDAGAMPIGSPERRAYTPTDRGTRSLAYLIALARAKLLARARAIEVSVTIPLTAGLALSCRKNVTVTDPRLPNGIASGKIVNYRIVAGGDGAQYASLTIGCTIGTGGLTEEIVGTPVYADEYADGYFIEEGATHAILSGDVAYGDLGVFPINDDGFDFGSVSASSTITSLTITNPASQQAGVLSGSFPDINAAVEELNRAYTEVTLELKPLNGGPFETDFNIALTNLVVPQTMIL